MRLGLALRIRKLRKFLRHLEQQGTETLDTLQRLEDMMGDRFDQLTERVRNLETVGDSLVELVKGLAAEVRAEGLEELGAEIDAKAAAWAAAVQENSPTPETPPAE